MKFIIQVVTPEEYQHTNYLEEALKKYMGKRKGVSNNNFEVFDSPESRESTLRKVGDNLGSYDELRSCTTLPSNCYPNATMTGRFDFDSTLGEYFIEVEAGEGFNPSGKFYPRILCQDKVYHPDKIQIVAIDYIVKGGIDDAD